MTILPTIVLPGRVPRHDREFSPTFVGRLRAVIAGASVPPPDVRPGDFNGIGRDSGHDGTNRLVSIDLGLQARKSIQADHFLVGRVPGALVIDMPRGKQNAMQDRVNITAGSNVAYGDIVSLSGPTYYTNAYAKLI